MAFRNFLAPFNIVANLARQGAVLLGTYEDISGRENIVPVAVDPTTYRIKAEAQVEEFLKTDMKLEEVYTEDFTFTTVTGTTYQQAAVEFWHDFNDPVMIFYINLNAATTGNNDIYFMQGYGKPITLTLNGEARVDNQVGNISGRQLVWFNMPAGSHWSGLGAERHHPVSYIPNWRVKVRKSVLPASDEDYRLSVWTTARNIRLT